MHGIAIKMKPLKYRIVKNVIKCDESCNKIYEGEWKNKKDM